MRSLLPSLIGGAAAAAAATGSVKYDPASHLAKPSSGCGKQSPYKAGATTVAKGKYAGVEWTYRVRMPKDYDPKTPVPLVVHAHGWGLTAKAEEHGSGLGDYADSHHFIAVFPQGMNDNAHKGGPWYSWNCVGSTGSPGPAGATCTSAANFAEYCYTSCEGKQGRAPANETSALPPAPAASRATGGRELFGRLRRKKRDYSYTYGAPSYSYGGGGSSGCADTPQCWWTTCDETVTPSGTGTKDVGGFLPGLYNTLEAQLCIDLSREYASGESNGGMQTYQLGVDLSSRLAAILPEFGSFHRGFAMAPAAGVALLDLHGTRDDTVPANVSLAANGYYYTTVAEIFEGGKYSRGWKAANGCKGKPTHWATEFDGRSGFYCVSEGECAGGDVVRCSWDGGHNWLFNEPTANGKLLVKFLLGWKKPSHEGYGRAAGEDATARGEPSLLDGLSYRDDTPADDGAEGPARAPGAGEAAGAPAAAVEGAAGPYQPHYGDPKLGCRDDEDTLLAGTGHVCAPKVATLDASHDDAATGDVGLPTPACLLGAVDSGVSDGCPKDALITSRSGAFPVCLAKGGEQSYRRGQFHCLLSCPCESARDGQCGETSHRHCPVGARCERGELRNRAQGVCNYEIV